MNLGRMRRGREKRLSISELGDGATFSSRDPVSLFRPNEAGLDATPERLLGLTAVYRAINFLCAAQAMLIPQSFRVNKETRDLERFMRTRLFEDPTGGFFTTYEWLDYELRSRLTKGNSFALKIGMTSTAPWPSRLAPLHPDRVRVAGIYGRRGELIDVNYLVTPAWTAPDFSRITSFEGVMAMVEQGHVLVDRSEMFHVPGKQFDGVSGVSPISACAMSLAIDSATEEAGARFYGSGSMMSGFLKTDVKLKADEAKAIKERWQSQFGGYSKAHEVAVLGHGMVFEPLSVNPQEAQFLEMRHFGVEQVSRIFGVPKALLSEGESFGSALEQQLTATEIFSLNEWLRPFEDRATKDLVPDTQVVRFNREPFDRADTKSRSAAISIYRTAQVISINEARRKIGLPPLEGADANDPMYAVTPPAADEPGGNEGGQGGGDDADQGETDPTDSVQEDT